MNSARYPNTNPEKQTSRVQRFYGQLDSQPERALRPWPTYMTARVAADYSDTSPWTIRRNVQPCGRRGRTFVYSIDAVEQWMRGASSQRTAATSRRNQAPDPARDRPKPPETSRLTDAVAERRRRVTT